MKNKINSRLVLIAIVAVITTVLGITTVYYGLFQKQIRKDLSVTAKLLRDTHFFETSDMDPTRIDLSMEMDDLRITWVDVDGAVLYDNDAGAENLDNHGNRPEIQEAFECGEGETVRRSDTMNKNTFYYALRLENGTVLRVAGEAESIWWVLYATLPLITGIIVVILAACVWLSHMLTRQLIRPIETMAENMEEADVTPPYKELVPFANMIRQQHADILSAAKARQDFTANVSHELKTPLTAISGYAELMETQKMGEEQRQHFLREIRKNAKRLLSLINDIIRLSELDRSQSAEDFEVIDLAEIVSESVSDLQVSAQNRNVVLTYQGSPCLIRANREMMRELADNLIQNAIRYNNDGGSVIVTVKGGNIKELIVKDNGIGIPLEEQNRVFERFYRVDKSRSKATGGTGLGLAIVKHIVELHHANIVLDSHVQQGTEIRILF